jgi:transcriptional regulator GlxA family with amidase domain
VALDGAGATAGRHPAPWTGGVAGQQVEEAEDGVAESEEDQDGEEEREDAHGRNPSSAHILPPVAEMTVFIDFLPDPWHAVRVISNVAVLVSDGVEPFELGVLHEVWGTDRSDDGLPTFDFAVCAPQAGPVHTQGPFDLVARHDLGRAAEADLVAVPASDSSVSTPEPILEAVRAAHERGARVLSLCTGAFVLGEAGLLDGRSCTTHWRHTDRLAERFPLARVVPEVLYVHDGTVLTSAGTAAGIDACLHLWRDEFGAAAAGAVARRMVVPPQREGGQAQFIRSPVPDCDAETLGPLLLWLTEHLAEPHTVESLAAAASMSPRTFARRFRAETGTTPHAWITSRRVLRAEELLESTDLSVDHIAGEVGFGTGAMLRHHFVRARSVSPQRYRRTFGSAAAGQGSPVAASR